MKEENDNYQSAVMSLLHQLEEDYGIAGGQMLVCAEHTGQYTFPLACACKAVACKLWLERPTEIKYSSGVQRGKNHKVDAKRIAIYARRFQDKVQYYERPTEDIRERLKQLESERTLYVTDLAKYKGQMKDQKDYMPKALYERKMKRLEGVDGDRGGYTSHY
ncbi:IS110 family transposase [Phocaeicola vulgatus]|uniref:IS110 family transposase n=1 Tax=Phocaeicola vulgatus TaxID=821 RepID=UPI003AB87416